MSIEIRPHFCSSEDISRLSKQNKLVLETLLQRSMFNYEFHILGILNYTARVSETREWLEKRGYTIKGTMLHGGVWKYNLEKYPTQAIQMELI